MRFRRFVALPGAGFVCLAAGLFSMEAGQGHQPAATPPSTQPAAAPKTASHSEDAASVARGKAAFQANCGFCHGNDATGSRAPDLLRSNTLTHDEGGNLVGQVVRNGRVAQGMPAFPTLKDETISDIAAYLHHQAYEAAHSAHVPGDYPLAKLLTGNAQQGKAYFDGAGGCSGCHSVTGDLAGVSKKYSPVDLQQHMVYPETKGKAFKTAVVTAADGTRYQGVVTHDDEFTISLRTSDGWDKSWNRADVKAEVTDKLAAHRELMSRYTDADMHNLFAYLETLK